MQAQSCKPSFTRIGNKAVTQHLACPHQLALLHRGRKHAVLANSSPGRIVENVAGFVDKQILPVSLVAFIALGLTGPGGWLGCAAYDAGLSNWVTISIFIISGLQLKRGDALAAAKSTGCVSFGLSSILLFTPLLAYVVMRLPLPPQALPVVLGTAVFCCMPTTLSSGISMTAAIGGNTALAILLTLASNMLGVFTMPLVLPALLGSAVGSGCSSLQPAALFAKLTKVVLLPTILGACARAYIPGLAAAVDRNRRAVVYASALCLAFVPWMQVSRSVTEGLSITVGDVGLACLLGAASHIVFLAFNVLGAQLLQLGGPDRYEAARLKQALVLQASQKTLPVAVAVIAGMVPSSSSVAAATAACSTADQLVGASVLAAPGAAGLAAIAVVVAHLTQIIIDSMLLAPAGQYLENAKAA